MSAFVVAPAHIHAILTYAIAHRMTLPGKGGTVTGGRHGNASLIGQRLLDANLASVAFRYTDAADLPGDADRTYRYQPYVRPVSTVAFIKALHCLSYQSCERPDWSASDARALITSWIELATFHLPGYDEAQWEIAG